MMNFNYAKNMRKACKEYAPNFCPKNIGFF